MKPSHAKCCLQPVQVERPSTAKPRNPDDIDFQDESVKKDYYKMFDRIKEMEALLALQQKAKLESYDKNDDEEKED